MEVGLVRVAKVARTVHQTGGNSIISAIKIKRVGRTKWRSTSPARILLRCLQWIPYRPAVTPMEETTMQARQQYAESDPRHHTMKIKGMLADTATHLREDIGKVADPRAQALFETTREVLNGLVKAYDDFERKNEAAWR